MFDAERTSTFGPGRPEREESARFCQLLGDRPQRGRPPTRRKNEKKFKRRKVRKEVLMEEGVRNRKSDGVVQHRVKGIIKRTDVSKIRVRVHGGWTVL